MSQPPLLERGGSWRGAGGGSLAQRHSGGSSGAVGALEATRTAQRLPWVALFGLGGGASGRKTLERRKQPKKAQKSSLFQAVHRAGPILIASDEFYCPLSGCQALT